MYDTLILNNGEIMKKINFQKIMYTKDHKVLKHFLINVLKNKKNDWASSWASKLAARNPNCPPEVLTKILRRWKDDDVSIFASINPSCPSEVLAEVLRRGRNDGVSCHAVNNSNCPPQARLDWLEVTGKLTKYDPDRFELEKVPEDKDLEELRKLM